MSSSQTPGAGSAVTPKTINPAAPGPSPTSTYNPILGAGGRGPSSGTPAAAASAAAAAATGGKSNKKSPGGGAGGDAGTKKKKARSRKRPSTSAGASSRGSVGGGGGSVGVGSAAAKEAIAAASKAKLELAELNAQADAIQNDPAWLSSDGMAKASALYGLGGDGTAVNVVGGGAEERGGFLTDEIEIVDNALRANGMGRGDVTGQAFGCLLEQARRYALELIADAQDYAHHSNRTDITSADLLLASEFRADSSVTSCLPPPDELFALSEEVNRVPLPVIPTNCYGGVVLPPVEHQLTARTFDIVSGAKVAQRKGSVVPSAASMAKIMHPTNTASSKAGGGAAGEVGGDPGKGRKKGTTASYGAARGRQIPVNLKSNKEGKAGPVASGGSGEGVSHAAATAAAAAAAVAGPGSAPAAFPSGMGTGQPGSGAMAPFPSGATGGLGGGVKRKADST